MLWPAGLLKLFFFFFFHLIYMVTDWKTWCVCLNVLPKKRKGGTQDQGGKWTPSKCFKISNIVMKNLWKILFLESKDIMWVENVLTWSLVGFWVTVLKEIPPGDWGVILTGIVQHVQRVIIPIVTWRGTSPLIISGCCFEIREGGGRALQVCLPHNSSSLQSSSSRTLLWTSLDLW